mgnify:CR=1 FL=1
MNVLKTISGAFSRLWRWITETAWVQPLLIVGGLFAIIFSISKFINWFSVMAVGTNSGYFTSYRISMENEGKEGYESDADKFATTIKDYSFKEYDSYEAAKAELESNGVISAYGEKYFFIIVENNCSGCDQAQAALEVLTSGWNNANFKIEDNGTFNLHTINADQESTNDSDFDLEEDQKAFTRFVNKFADRGLWEETAGRLIDRPYRLNKSVSESKYEAIENGESGSWETPTIYLVDWSKAAYEAGCFGIGEVLFGLPSSDNDYDKATLLQQMWNHVSIDGTADKNNPFRDNSTGL